MPSVSSRLQSSRTPSVTVIRPVKGLEPFLYDCLASCFRQDYPPDRLSVHICVETRDDPAFPTIEQLLHDFEGRDVRIFVEADTRAADRLGPNAKIRNMSRAYAEAKGDIVWIMDSNAWVDHGVCGRMVDRLCGLGPDGNVTNRPYKFVHTVPIAVSVDDSPGAALDEMFLSTAHAKMYTAINTVLIAPCVVGKSSMFRCSHLNFLTQPGPSLKPSTPLTPTHRDDPPILRPPGIDYFSWNICEDHLMGDRLWKGRVPDETAPEAPHWGKHSLAWGDLAFQPVAQTSTSAYFARRARWLRVRKFTVPAATLVEPGTESFVWGIAAAWAITTLVPEYLRTRGFEGDWCAFAGSWMLFAAVWLGSVATWCMADRWLFLLLQSGATVEQPVAVDGKDNSHAVSASDTSKAGSNGNICKDNAINRLPPFVRRNRPRLPALRWAIIWLGREMRALPIWLWAVLGGVTVEWRGSVYRVGLDMVCREVGNGK